MIITSRLTHMAAAMTVAIAVVGCSTDPEVAKQAFVKSGDQYVAEKKFSEAVIQYRNAIQKDPKFGEARVKLADAYMQTGDAQNAGREYLRAADLLADREDVQAKAVGFLLLFGQFADAKARAETMVKHNPQSAEAQILLGSALAGLKDLDGAVKEVEEAIKIDPTNGRAYANLGALPRPRSSEPWNWRRPIPRRIWFSRISTGLAITPTWPSVRFARRSKWRRRTCSRIG